MRKFIWVFIFISSGAIAATCPTGFVPVSWPANIKLSAACDADAVDLGVLNTECSTDVENCAQALACDFAREIKTDTGVHATLYSDVYTTPAIYINFGDVTCYANLVTDGQDSGLRVQTDEALYHTADLHRCQAKISASSSHSVITPGNNSVSWSGKIAGVDFSAMSLCGSDWGSDGNTKSYLGASTTTNDNRYCWCRMLVPVVSLWVFGGSFSSGTGCDTSCANTCASAFSNNATFRSLIISGIAN